jgi:hypothetical protein
VEPKKYAVLKARRTFSAGFLACPETSKSSFAIIASVQKKRFPVRFVARE